jgi:integrase
MFDHFTDEWKSCMESFLHQCYMHSGSAKSRSTYEYTLKRFFSDPERQPDEFGREDVRAFIHAPSDGRRNPHGPVCANTVNQRLMAINSYWKFAAMYEVRQADGSMAPIFTGRAPSYGFRYLKAGAPDKNMSETDITRFFAAIPDTVRGMRDRCIFLLAFITCRRISELCSLRWGDIEAVRIRDTDGSTRDAYVFTHVDKGSQREAHRSELPTLAYESIITMLESQGRLATIKPEDPLFTSLCFPRDKDKNTPLTARWANESFVATAARAGLRPGLSFHSLRHAGATERVRQGEPLPSLQKILGHTSLASTDRYVRSLMEVSDTYGRKLSAKFSYLAAAQ